MADVDLDLGALAAAPINIRDRAGRVWQCDSTMPLYTMFRLYRLARQAAENGGDTSSFGIDEVSEVVDGLHAIFAGANAQITREDVERSFTLPEMLQVIAFLSSRVEEAAEGLETAPIPEPQDPETSTAGAKKTTTRKPQKSAVSSSPEN